MMKKVLVAGALVILIGVVAWNKPERGETMALGVNRSPLGVFYRSTLGVRAAKSMPSDDFNRETAQLVDGSHPWVGSGQYLISEIELVDGHYTYATGETGTAGSWWDDPFTTGTSSYIQVEYVSSASVGGATNRIYLSLSDELGLGDDEGVYAYINMWPHTPLLQYFVYKKGVQLKTGTSADYPVQGETIKLLWNDDTTGTLTIGSISVAITNMPSLLSEIYPGLAFRRDGTDYNIVVDNFEAGNE